MGTVVTDWAAPDERAAILRDRRVQYETAGQVGILGEGGLINDKFMAMYGGHGVAGGVASAITPSKVNNAVVTIGEGPDMEAQVMGKLLVVTIVLTVVINVMTGIFVSLF